MKKIDLCKCGIAIVDCEYHKPSTDPLEDFWFKGSGYDKPIDVETLRKKIEEVLQDGMNDIISTSVCPAYPITWIDLPILQDDPEFVGMVEFISSYDLED
jgi:hypothetical protein